MTFNEELTVKCDVCGKSGHWEPTVYLLDESNPPIGSEPLCPTCIKAIDDATTQQRYLKRRRFAQK